ncbi:hypothetical protein UT300019_28600 [Clostridium sp. CTA-19]
MELINNIAEEKILIRKLMDVEEILNLRENKGVFKIKSENKNLSPDIHSIVYLRLNDSIIERFKLAFKIKEIPMRIYEVEMLCEGKSLNYLYKDSILKIISNRIKEELELENLNPKINESLLKAYKGAIKEAYKTSLQS